MNTPSFLASRITMMVLLGFLAFSLMAPACSPVRNSPVDSEGAPKNSSTDEMRIEVLVKLSEKCSLFDPEVENPFFYRISAFFSEPLENSSQISLYLPTGAATFNATATYRDGAQKTIQPTIVPLGYGATVVPIFYFDEGLTGFEIKLWGEAEGLSLLWRNLVDVSFIPPSFSRAVPTSYRIQIEAPNTLEVTSITSPWVQTLKLGETLEEGSKIYTLLIPTSITVYYRPSYWLSVAITIVFIIMCAAVFLPYFLKTPPSSVLMVYRKISDLIGTVRRGLNTERFFTLYMLCSLLMISLSLIAGPDPRIKIYAVTTPYLASTLENTLADNVGPVQVIGPHDTTSELETMVNLGVIKGVFVSYYPKLALSRWIDYILKALDQVGLIVVDELTADPELANDLKLRFGSKVVFVKGFDEASLTEASKILRKLKAENPFNLEPQIGFFKAAATVVAVLSFLTVFFGLAFLSSRLIDAGRSKGLGALPEAIMLPAFTFYFTQAIYMASSVLLATPIGLHAVTSGSREITVVGLLGFGGGSSPRAVSGVLGFLLGALIATKGRSELDRWGLIVFMVLTAILVIDPFTGGELFYDALLYFLSGPRSDVIRTSIVYARDIFSSLGRFFGGWVTSVYGLSTGEILFYAGALPIFLFPILKRSTATSLLLICCLAAGSGFIRTAEMTPYKTVASLIPGLVAGLAVTALFTAVSFIETHIRRRL